MKCGDCKYLGEEIKTFDYTAVNAIEIPTGFHQCERIKHIGQDGHDMKGLQDLAVVVDGSGYMGAIRVKKDFGCVNFELKK